MVKNLVKLIDEFKDKRILVVGDVMLDQFIWGEIKRVNPEQPASHSVTEIEHTYLLGGAANVANNISALGGICDLWGCFGNDHYGRKIKKLCNENAINLKNFYDKNPTIVKIRVMAHGQQITRIEKGEYMLKKINKETEQKIFFEFKNNIQNYDFVVFSDYNKSLFTPGLSYNMVNSANQENIGTLADLKPVNSNFFKKCTIVCPNKHEAEEITNIKYSKDNGTLKRISENLITDIQPKYVVITCSEDGAFLYGNDMPEPKQIPTRARAVADVTGAGDTFAASIALGMSCGANIEEVIELSNYAAGIVVGKVGTATTTPNELKEYVIDQESKV